MEGGMDSDRGDGSGVGALDKLSTKLSQFLSELKTVKTGQYLLSLAQLCYADTQLAYDMWVQLFGRLWSCLSDQQRQVRVWYVYGGRRRLDEGEEEGGRGRGWEGERLSEGLGEQEGGGKLKMGGDGEGRMKGTNTPVAVPSNENKFIMNHNHSW